MGDLRQNLLSALGLAEDARLSGPQCRAARGLLDITREELARLSGVSLATLLNLETGRSSLKPGTLRLVRCALEAHGVLFIPGGGGGEGVRMRLPGTDRIRGCTLAAVTPRA